MLIIRPYEPSDQDEMLRVWYEASVIAHHFVPPSFWAAERKAIVEEYVPIAETWVAEVDGRITGFHALIGDELGALFVEPAHQGKGVGARLLEHARSLRDRLTLHVFRANEGARRFYVRHGFRPIGETIEERTGCAQLEMEAPGSPPFRGPGDGRVQPH